jgi:hypothetical protein
VCVFFMSICILILCQLVLQSPELLLHVTSERQIRSNKKASSVFRSLSLGLIHELCPMLSENFKNILIKSCPQSWDEFSRKTYRPKWKFIISIPDSVSIRLVCVCTPFLS